jgi:hypothetical protein
MQGPGDFSQNRACESSEDSLLKAQPLVHSDSARCVPKITDTWLGYSK